MRLIPVWTAIRPMPSNRHKRRIRGSRSRLLPGWDGQLDLIGSAYSVNCLQQQIEVEPTFHLLRLIVLDRDRIAAVHLP